MSYKFMQFGDKTPIDGDRLSTLSSNNKILYDKINSKPSGILLRAGVRTNTTTIPSGYSEPVNVSFKVDPGRYVKVKIEVGHINMASGQEVFLTMLLYDGVTPSAGYSDYYGFKPYVTSGATPPSLDMVRKITSAQISSNGRCYFKLISDATSSYQAQRYIDITISDIGREGEWV